MSQVMKIFVKINKTTHINFTKFTKHLVVTTAFINAQLFLNLQSRFLANFIKADEEISTASATAADKNSINDVLRLCLNI